ncbi:TPA: RidA family protein [Pseudomonas putida]|nr:RidA family protein [Pseudomonas putida]
MNKTALLLGAFMSLSALTAQADTIKRVDPPGSKFPISQLVTVPAGTSLTFVSGTLPDVADPKAPPQSIAAYGNTETQTRSVLKKIQAALQSQGLGLGDVVQLRVFLVGDPATEGKLDFAGLQAAYTEFFATAEQPRKPTRTALQVVALPLPGALVEIEAVAAKAP